MLLSGELQLCLRLCPGEHGDLEIAVPDPQFIDHFFLFCRILHPDPEGQTVHAAHTGGFYADVFRLAQIAGKRFLKSPAVIQGFRDTNELGMQMFELSPGYDISKQRICQIMQYTRCLMIADSCRRIVPLAEGGRMPQTRIFSQSHAHDDYKNACRRIYNEKFLSVQVGSFSLGNSASFNQAAGEDNNGGLYSCELLKKAKDEIIRKKNECRAAYYEPIISFSYIHSLARESVMAKTNNQQVPDYATLRGNQPPFVVVP